MRRVVVPARNQAANSTRGARSVVGDDRGWQATRLQSAPTAVGARHVSASGPTRTRCRVLPLRLQRRHVGRETVALEVADQLAGARRRAERAHLHRPAALRRARFAVRRRGLGPLRARFATASARRSATGVGGGALGRDGAVGSGSSVGVALGDGASSRCVRPPAPGASTVGRRACRAARRPGARRVAGSHAWPLPPPRRRGRWCTCACRATSPRELRGAAASRPDSSSGTSATASTTSTVAPISRALTCSSIARGL